MSHAVLKVERMPEKNCRSFWQVGWSWSRYVTCILFTSKFALYMRDEYLQWYTRGIQYSDTKGNTIHSTTQLIWRAAMAFHGHPLNPPVEKGTDGCSCWISTADLVDGETYYLKFNIYYYLLILYMQKLKRHFHRQVILDATLSKCKPPPRKCMRSRCDLNIRPLTLKTFSSSAIHIMITCAKCHRQPSTTC